MSPEEVLKSQVGTYPWPRFLWWDRLAEAAGSVTVRRYFIFIVLVPVVATLLGGLNITKDVKLPLAIVLAYAAALLLFLGAILVEFACPDINRVGRTYAAFQREGRNKQYIIQQLRETYLALAISSASRANHFLNGLLRYVNNMPAEIKLEVANLGDQKLTRQRLWQIAEQLVEHPPDDKECFWHIQWFAASTRPWIRFTCFLFFVLGGMISFAALVAQTITVAKVL